MIRVTCPHCTQPIEADDELAGREIACPGCPEKFIIPHFATAPATVIRNRKLSHRAVLMAAIFAVFATGIGVGLYQRHVRDTEKEEKGRIAKIKFEKNMRELDEIGADADRMSIIMRAETLAVYAEKLLKATHFGHRGDGYVSIAGSEYYDEISLEFQEMRARALRMRTSVPDLQEAQDLSDEMFITFERILGYYVKSSGLRTYSVDPYSTSKLAEDYKELMENNSRIELKTAR